MEEVGWSEEEVMWRWEGVRRRHEYEVGKGEEVGWSEEVMRWGEEVGRGKEEE